MKICVLSTTFLPNRGGAERFCDGLCRHLKKLGHDVQLLVPYSSEGSDFPYTIIRLKYLQLGDKIPYLMPWIIALNLLIYHRKYKFEIIQAVGFYPGGYGASIFKRLFSSVVVIVRGTGSDVQVNKELNYGLRLDSTIESKIRKTITKIDCCVANSQSMKDDLIHLGASGKVSIIPNGIDLDRFQNRDYQLDKIRTDITGNPMARIILNVGRIEARKNQKLLIDSFNRLNDNEKQNTFVVLVGSNENADQVFNTQELSSHIVLLGKLENKSDSYEPIPPQKLIDLFLASTIYAHPSLLEGQPNVLLEALAAGLPVVACDVAGSTDVIEHGKTGLLVSPNIDAFSEALDDLLSQKETRIAMSKNAIVTAREYNWDKVVKMYEELYKKVAAHH